MSLDSFLPTLSRLHFSIPSLVEYTSLATLASRFWVHLSGQKSTVYPLTVAYRERRYVGNSAHIRVIYTFHQSTNGQKSNQIDTAGKDKV